MEFSAPCDLSAEGAEVLLRAPLRFQGSTSIRGDVRFRALLAFREPCVAVGGNFSLHPTANVAFEGCHNSQTTEEDEKGRQRATDRLGGALKVAGDVELLGGALLFVACRSARGGALYAEGSFRQSGGRFEAAGCSAEFTGGALNVQGDIEISGGHLAFRNCTSGSGGGAVSSDRGAVLRGGSLLLEGCSSTFGGGIAVYNGGLTLSGGDVRVRNSTSHASGGAIYVAEGIFEVSGGNISIHNASSENDVGGAVHAADGAHFRGGQLLVEGCSAESGGALAVKGGLNFSGGIFSSKWCDAEYRGGALSVEDGINFSGGLFSSKWCAAESFGGAIAISGGGFNLSGGHVEIEQATVQANGGALFISEMGSFQASGGHLSVRHTEARGSAGAIQIPTGFFHLSGGNISIRNATARNDAGGAISAERGFFMRGGHLLIEGCLALADGGGISTQNFSLSGGDLRMAWCDSKANGGAIFARGHVEVSGGDMTVRHATSQIAGGGVYARQGANFSGGQVLIQDTMSQTGGGAIFAMGPEEGERGESFEVSGGNLSIIKAYVVSGTGGAICAYHVSLRDGRLFVHGASSERGGAIMVVRGDMIVTGGTFESEHTVSLGEGEFGYRVCGGGAIYLQQGSFEMHKGSVLIRNSTAKKFGGAIATHKDVSILGGSLRMDSCRATSGGAIAMMGGNFTLAGGDLRSELCTASRYGGAIYSSAKLYQILGHGPFEVTGGNMSIRNASAGFDGGAISSQSSLGVALRGGRVDLEHCEAGLAGGGISLDNGDLHVAGAFSCKWCTSKKGGSIYVRNGSMTVSTEIDVLNSLAHDLGGGVYVGRSARFEAGLRMGPATAREGGCLYVVGSLTVRGTSLFRACTASGRGGALSSQGDLKVQDMAVVGGGAPSAGIFVTLGNASVASLRVDTLRPGQAMASSLVIGSVDCLASPGCQFETDLETGNLQLGNLACGRGLGWVNKQGEASCQSCSKGHTRLTMHSTSCTRCPAVSNVTISCEPTMLGVPAGFMVVLDPLRADDLSEWYQCPSDLACSGGLLNASSGPGEPLQVIIPMCSGGYTGPGCTRCMEDHARGDSNVLQCVECATSRPKVVRYVAFYIIKNLALFASAVGSVTGAKAERAASATLLNQLMAFAAVAGVAMSGAMQTQAFQSLQQGTQDLLEYFLLPVDIAQGQTSGGPQMSAECLLALMGMEKTVHHAHVLMSIWPAVLVAGLGVLKGGWLAAVVGTNVFLPAFTAAFGKYLVVFRLRPERLGGELHWDFLPPGPAAAVLALVVASVCACFALGAGSWLYVVQFRQEPMRPHVAYLMQAYRVDCSVWEVERLARKMLLALVTTMLPVTLSPALQMEAVSLILTASAGLHYYFQPYKVESFNSSEIALLALALTMTGLTTTLVANDLHWARSMFTQLVMIFLVSFLAAGVCLVMIIRFALAFRDERRPAASKEETADI